jgi:hypothetical protein
MSSRRTQVYLTEAQHRAATELAHQRGTTLAAVVRESLDRYLASEASAEGVSWEGDPTLALVGQVRMPPLPADATMNDAIDAIVYDEEAPCFSQTPPASSPSSTAAMPGTPRPPKRGGRSPKRGGKSSRRSSSSRKR